MKYNNILPAVFLDRPNRFIAHVELNSSVETVHVKNTGRCKELLVRGCQVYLSASNNPARKTKYDLVAVEKGPLLINMDSQAPNTAVGEWLRSGGLGQMDKVQAEYRIGDSRFDFYAERSGDRFLIEVKGCTLEVDGMALFPDAPTLRGVKHVHELAQYAREGWHCAVIILVQTRPVRCFKPNWATHADFGHALREADASGVNILAFDSIVTPDSLSVGSPVPVLLDVPESF